MIPSFRELLVWKKVDKLAHQVYDISETFPGEYVFDLTNSLRRSALSIPENIAEMAVINEATGTRFSIEVPCTPHVSFA